MEPQLITYLDLDELRYNSRLLLIYAPSAEDEMFRAQAREFEGRRGDLLERDMILFYVLEVGTSRMDYDSISPEIADHLRHEYKVPHGEYAVVLVGKDGGVKERWNGVVEAATVFDAVDAMPMRREETRGKGREASCE